jgi:hypothetical protein
MTLDEVLEMAAAEDWDFRKTFYTPNLITNPLKKFAGFRQTLYPNKKDYEAYINFPGF